MRLVEVVWLLIVADGGIVVSMGAGGVEALGSKRKFAPDFLEAVAALHAQGQMAEKMTFEGHMSIVLQTPIALDRTFQVGATR